MVLGWGWAGIFVVKQADRIAEADFQSVEVEIGVAGGVGKKLGGGPVQLAIGCWIAFLLEGLEEGKKGVGFGLRSLGFDAHQGALNRARWAGGWRGFRRTPKQAEEKGEKPREG